MARGSDLLVKWWETSILWAWDNEHPVEHKTRDLRLIIAALHVLATNGPPDEASSPTLRAGVQAPVSVETAAKGVGPARRVELPRHMWDAWVDPQFDWAGRNAPTKPHSNCPKAAAMVRALVKEGLMEEAQLGDRPNAHVFVKHKSDTKAALIMNMVAFNHTCAHKARRFKLPSLEGLCGVLREVGGLWRPRWTCRTAIGPSSYRHGYNERSVVVVRVPFGWH